jgi:hypothetical protein
MASLIQGHRLETIRKIFHGAETAVWHSEKIRAWCFKEQNVESNMVCRLDGLVKSGGITDYLLVEPITVPLTSFGDMSPLANWITKGHELKVPEFRIPDRKNEPIVKTITVETRSRGFRGKRT